MALVVTAAPVTEQDFIAIKGVRVNGVFNRTASAWAALASDNMDGVRASAGGELGIALALFFPAEMAIGIPGYAVNFAGASALALVYILQGRQKNCTVFHESLMT